MCKVAFSGRKRHSAVSILQSAEANPLGRKEQYCYTRVKSAS